MTYPAMRRSAPRESVTKLLQRPARRTPVLSVGRPLQWLQLWTLCRPPLECCGMRSRCQSRRILACPRLLGWPRHQPLHRSAWAIWFSRPEGTARWPLIHVGPKWGGPFSCHPSLSQWGQACWAPASGQRPRYSAASSMVSKREITPFCWASATKVARSPCPSSADGWFFQPSYCLANWLAASSSQCGPATLGKTPVQGMAWSSPKGLLPSARWQATWHRGRLWSRPKPKALLPK